jgi:hypothetical protein
MPSRLTGTQHHLIARTGIQPTTIRGEVQRRSAALITEAEGVLGQPLWRDWSSNQGQVDVDVAILNGVLGSMCRAGISWGFHDTRVQEYLTALKQRELYNTTYHVLYTNQSIVRQADDVWFAEQPEPDQRYPMPRVIDMEVDMGDSYGRKADAVMEMSNLVLARDGMRPIIYSRYRLVDDWLQSWSDTELNAHYWFLAQYLWNRAVEHPGPYTYPVGVDPARVLWIQTADKKQPTPYANEVQSASVDHDRWQLHTEETAMRAWIRDTWGGGTPPPTPSDHGHEAGSNYDWSLVHINQARSIANTVSIEALDAQIGEMNQTLINHEGRLNDLEDEDSPSTPGGGVGIKINEYTDSFLFHSTGDSQPTIGGEGAETEQRFIELGDDLILMVANYHAGAGAADGGGTYYIDIPLEFYPDPGEYEKMRAYGSASYHNFRGHDKIPFGFEARVQIREFNGAPRVFWGSGITQRGDTHDFSNLNKLRLGREWMMDAHTRDTGRWQSGDELSVSIIYKRLKE